MKPKKKLFEISLGMVIIVALFLGSAQSEDGGCFPLWSIICLAVSGACGLIYTLFFGDDYHA